MNQISLEGNWKQMQRHAKEWWTRLAYPDLDRAAGKSDRLIEMIQQAYGYTREHAEDEFNQWLNRVAAPQNQCARADSRGDPPGR